MVIKSATMRGSFSAEQINQNVSKNLHQQQQNQNRYAVSKMHSLLVMLVLFLGLTTLRRPSLTSSTGSDSLGTVRTQRSIIWENESEPFTCPHYSFEKRGKAELELSRANFDEAAKYARDHRLTFMKLDILQFHLSKLQEIENDQVPGMIVECGVAKAGSSIAIASYKHPQRCLHLFDTFEGMPKPSERDGNDVIKRYEDIQKEKRECEQDSPTCDKNYYGNMKDLLAHDIAQFQLAGYAPRNNSIFFHKGLFDDTVWPGGPIAYVHLDSDWYDSTFRMLQRMTPFLSELGFFVLDDVYNWSGAREAFVDFFGVNFEWLKEQIFDKKCWSTVQVINEEQPAQAGGTVSTTRYFLLELGRRAAAQIWYNMPSSTSFPSCKPP